MNSANNCTLLGNLTRDPEVKEVGETKVAKFGLAVNHTKDKVSFFDCEVWGKQAELAEKFLTKGRKVLLACEAVQETWEKDGQKRSAVKFKVEHFSFVGGPKEESDEPQTEETQVEKTEKKGKVAPSGKASKDSDVPF